MPASAFNYLAVFFSGFAVGEVEKFEIKKYEITKYEIRNQKYGV